MAPVHFVRVEDDECEGLWISLVLDTQEGLTTLL
jgi:hypothetical protein